MTAVFPASWPVGAAVLPALGRAIMDVILHIGAHRSGTTSFQRYLRDSQADLSARGIGFWGPARVRQSVFPGLFPGPAVARGRDPVRRAEGRVQMQVAQCHAQGLRQLLISDENMIGSARQCLRSAALYPAIGERMARIGSAFGGRIKRVVLSVRAPDLWWASAAAYTIGRGHPVPSAQTFDTIAQNPRSWRDVVTDLACALPETEIRVTPFEQFGGQPDALFTACTDHVAPAGAAGWLNRAPDLAALRETLNERGQDPASLPHAAGRWQPFNPTQASALRERYADDQFWLAAGADGLATLTEDPSRRRAGPSLPPGAMREGHAYDIRPKGRQNPLA
ncbi:hypothetical protein [Sulfitobacter maritimus]|uniref:hypothetical protein n=1 Tax=Sulfitobacter maritimus TaxID=2741719 RepID=UPI001FE96107|nr:hypothetical protein [Sulfitobacter maritimus]